MGARGPARRAAAALALAVAGLLPGLGAPAAGANPADDLHHGSWLLATPLGEVAGRFVVAGAPAAGRWRCEIAVAEDGHWPSRDEVLQRLGRGWTVTRTPDGSFLKPWSEPWRQLGPEATDAFGELIARWRADAGPVSGAGDRPHRFRPRRPWRPRPVVLDDWAGLPEDWRPPGEGPRQAGELRRRLAARGLGRGGEGLVLDLRREDGHLVATSARWPGRLVLREGGSEAALLPDEAFLPLWPLAEFLP